MIALTPHMRILLAVEPADFRKGIDGLAQLCRNHLKSDPFSGAVFVFRNKRATALKILVYDGQGFFILPVPFYRRSSTRYVKKIYLRTSAERIGTSESRLDFSILIIVLTAAGQA
jgi:hypothetical protein